MICSFNFLIYLAVCLNISTAIDIQILTNSNQQTQSYTFTSHIAAFLSGFDHQDAWNLHTNIWSKRSIDFKELSPCSVRYHLNINIFNRTINKLRLHFKTKSRPRVVVWLVNIFNCLEYDWTVKYEWNVTRHDP